MSSRPPIGARALAPELAEAVEAFAHGFEIARRTPRARVRAALARELGLDSALTMETAKLAHTTRAGAILYLAPARSSGAANLCPNASGCVSSCLAEHSGRLRFDSAREARVRRTRAFLQSPRLFGELCGREATALARRTYDHGRLLRPMLRLDGGSDLGLGLALLNKSADQCADFVLFDYSKSTERAERALAVGYRLAFSLTRATAGFAFPYRARGGTLAVVVDAPRSAAMPRELAGARCIDGDRTGEDWATLRPQERAGALVLLRFKGSRAKRAAARRVGFAFSLEEIAQAVKGGAC